jgi:hypothetical protein
MMGYIGTSPYLINLSGDFATIPYTYDNVITQSVFDTIDFTFQVFNGAKELKKGTDYVLVSTINGELDTTQNLPQVVVKTNQASATLKADGMIDIGYDETIYTADWSRGTITVELYLDNIKMASATYELARQAGGVDGSYEYLITNAPIIKKLTDAKGDVSYEPNTITLTLLKRVGDKDPVTSTATRWAKTYIDGELTTEKQSFQGSLTVNGEVTTEVKVEVFADEACTSIIDREIVPVIADGVDAYNSAVITVYCRTDKDPVPPGKAEYDFNQKNQHQSLVWTSSSNGWSLEPQPDDGLGTTRYKSMVSIRNREHLHKIAEDDWSSAIVDELPKTYEEVLTFYTTVVLPQDKTPEEVKPSKPIIPTYNIKERKFEGNLPSGWT